MTTLEQEFIKAEEKRENGQIDQAIAEYQRLRIAAIRSGESQLATQCFHMIGVSYYQQEEYVMAKDYLNRALEEVQRSGETWFIGVLERDIALIAYKEKEYKTARELLHKSIAILQTTPTFIGQKGMSQVKLGVVMATDGELEEGEKMIQQGINALAQSTEKFFLSTGYFNLAFVLQKEGKVKEAKQAALTSQQLLDTISKPSQFQVRRNALAEFMQLLQN